MRFPASCPSITTVALTATLLAWWVYHKLCAPLGRHWRASACLCMLVPPDILAAEAHRPLGRIITGLYLTVRFAMQVARSLRIRSHRLAVPAGKARRTQVQLHAAPRGNVGWLTDTSLLPERKMHANLLFFRCTQPEADGSLEYSLSTDTGRKPNSEERRALC